MFEFFGIFGAFRGIRAPRNRWICPGLFFLCVTLGYTSEFLHWL